MTFFLSIRKHLLSTCDVWSWEYRSIRQEFGVGGPSPIGGQTEMLASNEVQIFYQGLGSSVQ